MPDEAIHFICSECGGYVVQLSGPDPASRFNLCGFCLTIPGWYTDPEIRERLGREGAG